MTGKKNSKVLAPLTMTNPWWHPDRHRDRRPALLLRGRIKAALRAWFEREGFVEVEPGAIQVSPGNEIHLHAFATEAEAPDLSRRRLYLHTSPEFAMKKLLAAGEPRIFAFAQVYRNRERGQLHAPEFTMLEWYRANEPYGRLIEDCQAILKLAAEATERTTWERGGKTCDVTKLSRRLGVVEAFAEHAGIDLAAALSGGEGEADGAALAGAARAAGIRVADDDTWSDIFSRVLTERIEPHLGVGAPDTLDRYPAREASLARPCPDDPRVAERFELYVAGVEIANGFGELTDARLQRERLQADMAERRRRYGTDYPLDEDFLAALAAMPPASGIALGFDRLVMLATGARSVEEVMWTPFPDVAGGRGESGLP